MNKKSALCLLLFILCFLCYSSYSSYSYAAEPARYDITLTKFEVANLPFYGDWTVEVNNNNLSIIAGWYQGFDSFTYDINTGRLALIPSLCPSCPLYDQNTHAADINDAGQVVGATHIMRTNPKAFIWDPNNGIVQISEMNGKAQGLNATGHVVGTLYPDSDISHAFYWDGEAMTDLHSDIEAYYGKSFVGSSAIAINDANQIAGWAYDDTGEECFVWNNGIITDLDNLTGIRCNVGDITESGIVVGTARTRVGGPAFACLWENGQIQDLGTLGAVHGGFAYGINENRVVVGSSTTLEGEAHAFVWNATEGMLDLNDLIAPVTGLVLDAATGINENGVITGVSYLDGVKTGFILIPKPMQNPPSANAGADSAVSTRNLDEATIVGTAVDYDEEDVLEYRWLAGGVVLQGWTPVSASGECPLELGNLGLIVGSHVLVLEVRDGVVTEPYPSDRMLLTIFTESSLARAYDLIIPEISIDGLTFNHEMSSAINNNGLVLMSGWYSCWDSIVYNIHTGEAELVESACRPVQIAVKIPMVTILISTAR